MSKKQARQKKQLATSEKGDLSSWNSLINEPKKPLIITPQIAVSIQGEYPNQALFVEQPNGSATRKKVELTRDNAYNILLDILMEKAGGIELERQLTEERRSKGPRKRAQPDFRIIAQHPEVVIIERLATRAGQLVSNKSDKTLEEMGL